MDAYKFKFGERRRFEHVMFALKFEESVKVVESIMLFANMLVNLPDSLADRLSMRSELRGLHIEAIFNSVEKKYPEYVFGPSKIHELGIGIRNPVDDM
jgi:hypothetical protein